MMAFVKISDYNDSIEVVVFPKAYIENKNLIVAEKIVAIRGKISLRNGEVGIIADAIKEL